MLLRVEYSPFSRIIHVYMGIMACLGAGVNGNITVLSGINDGNRPIFR